MGQVGEMRLQRQVGQVEEFGPYVEETEVPERILNSVAMRPGSGFKQNPLAAMRRTG